MHTKTAPVSMDDGVRSMKVLVVDSSVDDANAIARLLRQHSGTNFKVITATNILNGIREFKQEEPDCVLVDHRLNDGEGVEFLRMLNEITAPMPAPVVFLSGADSPRLAVRVLKAGAMDFLSKAWLDSESLIRAVEHAIQRSESMRRQIQTRIEVEDANIRLEGQIASLRQSERVNQEITGRAPVFLYVNDILQDRNVSANQTMLDALGFAESEWTGMAPGSWSARIHPDDLEIYSEHVSRLGLAQEGETFCCEYRVQRRDGAYLPLSFRESIFVRNGNHVVTQVVGTAQVLSPRAVVASPAVAMPEPSTAPGFDRIGEVVWDQDGIGMAVCSGGKSQPVLLNRTLAGWLGLEETTSLTEFARAFGFAPTASSFSKAISRGVETHDAERTVLMESGEALKLIENVRPLSDASGRSNGFIANFVPISIGIQARLEEAERRQVALKEIESQLTDSRRENETLRDRVGTANPDSERSEAAVTSAIERARLAEERLDELDTRWRETLDLLLTADETRDKLNSQIKSLLSDLSLKDRELEQSLTFRLAAEELDRVRHDLQKAEAALAQAAKKAATRAEEIESKDRLIQELEAATQISLLRESELVQLRGQHKVESERTLHLESELAQSREELRRAELEFKNSVEELAQAKQRLVAEQNLEEQLGLVRAEAAELSLQKERAEQKATEIERAFEDLTKQVKQAEEALVAESVAHEQVRGEISELRANNERYETALAELREQSLSKQSSIDGLHSSRTGLAAQLQATEEQLAVMQRKLHEGEERWWKSYKDAETKQREASEVLQAQRKLEQELADLRLENSRLASLPSHSQDRSSGSDSAETVKQLEEVTLRLFDTQVEVVELQSRFQKAESELARASAELKRNERELAAATKQLEQANAAAAGVERERQELGERVTAVETELALERATLGEERKALEEARVLAEARADELAQLRTSAAERASQLPELQSTVDELTRRLAEQSETIEVLRAAASSGEEEWKRVLEEKTKSLAAAEELCSLRTAECAVHVAELEALRTAAAAWGTTRDQEVSGLMAKADLADELAAQFSASEQKYAALQLSFQKAELTLIEVEARANQTAQLLEASRKQAAQSEAIAAERALEISELEKRLDEERRLAADTTARIHDAQCQLSEAREEIVRTTTDLRVTAAARDDAAAAALESQKALELSEQERKGMLDRLLESGAQLQRTSEELRRAESVCRSLFGAVPSIVYRTNSLGVIEEVNEQWFALTRAEMRESQASGWKGVVHAEDLEGFLDEWQKNVRAGTGFSANLRIRRHDGAFRWHALQCVPQYTEKILSGWVGTITETHEQIASREAARQARMRYSAMLDRTAESVVFLSSTGHVLGASRASLELLRHSEGVVGTHLWDTDWWLKSEKEAVKDAVLKAAGGSHSTVETVRIAVDRQHRPTHLIIDPVPDENEAVSLLIAQFRDAE